MSNKNPDVDLVMDKIISAQKEQEERWNKIESIVAEMKAETEDEYAAIPGNEQRTYRLLYLLVDHLKPMFSYKGASEQLKQGVDSIFKDLLKK